MTRLTLTIISSVIYLTTGKSSVKVSEFIRKGIQKCQKNPGSCHNNQFFDTDVTQVSPSWFVFASSTPLKKTKEVDKSSGDSCWDAVSPAPGWQGAMYYREPTTAEEIYEGEQREGLYIYPDWVSCVEGLWEHHMLVEGEASIYVFLAFSSRHFSGYQCKIEDIDFEDEEIKITRTSRFRDTVLSYNPPNFYSFGLPPNLTDPFEKSTVFVRPSTFEGAGQGLFVRRAVRAGHLISFYSGLILEAAAGHERSSLDRRVEADGDRERRNANTLSLMDVTRPEKKFGDLCVFVPPEYSSLDQYSATLGHKANHDGEPNAR